MDFAQKLKLIMKEQSLSGYKIWKGTGISQGNINSWVKGESIPKDTNLGKLCSFLNVSKDYFTEEFTDLNSATSDADDLVCRLKNYKTGFASGGKDGLTASQIAILEAAAIVIEETKGD